MTTIDITKILSRELKSRSRVADFQLYLENRNDKNYCIDFSNVTFATRSFIDEFYKVFVKGDKQNSFSVALVNVPADIQNLLSVVSQTQVTISVRPATANITEFLTVEEMIKYMSTAQ